MAHEKGPKELHQFWEDESFVRDRFRAQGSLLKWSSEKTVSIPCMANISINYQVLIIMADFFCPLQTGIQTPKIGFIRAQAGSRKVGSVVLGLTHSIGSRLH